MAASRKLQVEIDRALKKVYEGVDHFDSIWNKLYDTDNASHKEKFENELKKEIKKLQKYRDQIKSWLQSTEIKDKKVLTDARKVIEKEMERFKICEKEAKTKAFSNKGLEQQPKTDPKEKAKSETTDWLNNTVSELESQIDSFEAEMERLYVKKGKTRPPRLTHLESSIIRHKAHISKLQSMLRLLDNDALTPEQVNDVKEFLDYYVERNQHDFDQFDDVNMLYDSLKLDTVESLEELVTIVIPGPVKGVGKTGAVSSLKSTMPTSAAQLPASFTVSIQQGRSVQESVDETVKSSKNSAILNLPPTSTGPTATPVAINASSSLSGPSSANSSSSVPPSTINSAIKEAEITSFPVQKPSPALPGYGLKNLGRGSITKPPSIIIPITSGSTVSSSGSHGVSPVSDIPKRTMLEGDDKHGNSGIVQPVVSSVTSRMVLRTCGETSDAVGNSEAEGRVFSPWRQIQRKWIREGCWTPGHARNPDTYALKDQETRYRKRYLDLILNSDVRRVFQTMAWVISYIRCFLDSRDFLEVKTPVLIPVASGGAACPFEVYYEAFGKTMFLRIAPELYLKQLVIGGMDRVYEIGEQFRNEGIDATHSPEFTTCEFYMANADYNDLMELTEELLSGMVKELTGGYKVTYHANGYDKDPIEIDFTPPFRRICMIEELEKIAELNIPKDLASDEANQYLANACIKFNIICPSPQTTTRLLNKLVGHFLEDTCVLPSFIIDHPEIMSPFAKSHPSKPGLTERFEFYVNKFELINAYSELNDPVEQRQRLANQLKDRQLGDIEAVILDEAFCEALEYGMPPTAGWGLGIDRLTLLLTDNPAAH